MMDVAGHFSDEDVERVAHALSDAMSDRPTRTSWAQLADLDTVWHREARVAITALLQGWMDNG